MDGGIGGNAGLGDNLGGSVNGSPYPYSFSPGGGSPAVVAINVASAGNDGRVEMEN